MKNKVYKYMKQQQMVDMGMTVLAGFSGGADSTALLQLLWEYGNEHGILSGTKDTAYDRSGRCAGVCEAERDRPGGSRSDDPI